jgi:hypothetical protein
MNSIQHYSSLRDLDHRQALDGSRWTEQEFYDYYGPEDGAYFWNEANRHVAEQHALFHASPHSARSPHVAEQHISSSKRTCTSAARVHTARAKFSSKEHSQMCTLDIVKHQYGQGCIESLRLLAKLKKDVDDASDEDYLLWQAEENEQRHTAHNFTATQLFAPELYPTEAVRYIQAATLEHACSNSWASTRTLPLHVTVGAVLHHALSRTNNKPHDESTESHRSRISRQTKDATKAFITAIINIKNVEFIKEALAQTPCKDEALHWINATKDKLEIARQTAEAKMQEYVESAYVQSATFAIRLDKLKRRAAYVESATL